MPLLGEFAAAFRIDPTKINRQRIDVLKMESFLSQNQGILAVEPYFPFTAWDIYWSLTQGAYFSRPTRLAVAVFSLFQPTSQKEILMR